MKYLLFTLMLVSSVHVTAESKRTTEKHVKVDLNGDGKAEDVLVRSLNKQGEEMMSFEVITAGQKTSVKGMFSSDSDDLWPTLKAIAPFPGDKTQWLLIEGVLSGFPGTCSSLIGFRKGRLEQLAVFKGVELRIPGNATILTNAWIGFWSRVVKWSIDADGSLKLVPQEFYGVGKTDVEVVRTFPLLETRNSEAVVARTKEGSKITILLWQGELPLTESKQLSSDELAKNYSEPAWLTGWYLIQTETGLIGWVRGEGLNEHLNLPIAG